MCGYSAGQDFPAKHNSELTINGRYRVDVVSNSNSEVFLKITWYMQHTHFDDDIMAWKYFPRCWSTVTAIPRLAMTVKESFDIDAVSLNRPLNIQS